jgi:hypothetical protein
MRILNGGGNTGKKKKSHVSTVYCAVFEGGTDTARTRSERKKGLS